MKIQKFLLILAVLPLIACDKDKPTQKEMVNACLFDPTGNCQRQAAAYAQGHAPAVLPYINAGQANQGGAVGNVPTVAVFSVNEAQIKAKAQSVQSAIEADNRNPSSLHFDPPQSYVPKQKVEDIEAARSLPTQNDQMGLPSLSAGTGSGDAVR